MLIDTFMRYVDKVPVHKKINSLFPKLNDATSFCLSNKTYNHINTLVEQSNLSYDDMLPYAKLPFETITLEAEWKPPGTKDASGDIITHNKLLYFATETSYGFYVVAIVSDGKTFPGVALQATCDISSFTNAEGHVIRDQGEDILTKPEDEAEWQAIEDTFKTFVHIMYVINCPEITEITRNDTAKLNKKRKLRGRQPIKEYNLITLNIEQEIATGSHGDSSGASRKAHFRRGHFRNLPRKQKVTWVRPHVVGSGDPTGSRYVIR